MTAEKLHDAITMLPSDLIIEADKARCAPKSAIRWQRYAAMAACFALVVCGSAWCLQNLSRGGTKEAAAEAPAAMQYAADEEAIPEMAEAAPKAPADSAAGEIAQDRNSNSACQAAVPQVTISGDFAPRDLTPEERRYLAGLLSELIYLPEDVCECIAEITVTVNGEDRFFINLEEGFVRCSKGQARLTEEQTDGLRAVFYRVEE